MNSPHDVDHHRLLAMKRARSTSSGAVSRERCFQVLGSFLMMFGVAGAAIADEEPLVFNAPVLTVLPEPFFPTMFRVRDIDGDGKQDLAIAGRDPDDRLLTYKGDGLGGFTPLQTLSAEGFTDWLEFGDMNSDGLVDIVSAWRGDVPRVVVYRGLAGGQFAAPVVVADIELGVGRDPEGITIGDFDADGDIDVVVSSYIGQSFEYFANNGGLNFERVQRIRCAQYLGGYGFPRMIESGDIDGDGDLDLVANQLGGGRIAVMRNESGRFGRAVEYRGPQIGNERPGISAAHLADIDGDGDLDIYAPALVLETTQRIVWLRNDGTGRFNERIVGDGPSSGYIFSVKLADLDSDGDLDMICGSALPGLLSTHRCISVGDFLFEQDGYYPFGSLVRHCDAFDYDGDCDLDLITIDGPGRTILTRRNITPQQGSGSGCGGLAASNRATKRQNAQAEPTEEVTSSKSAVVGSRSPLPSAAQHDWNEDGVVDASDVAVWLGSLSRPLSENILKAMPASSAEVDSKLQQKHSASTKTQGVAR
ncbi:MAG: hypothetical protein RL591_1144 [Planctomycetota bacterium]|jgi:hypothetical protein